MTSNFIIRPHLATLAALAALGLGGMAGCVPRAAPAQQQARAPMPPAPEPATVAPALAEATPKKKPEATPRQLAAFYLAMGIGKYHMQDSVAATCGGKPCPLPARRVAERAEINRMRDSLLATGPLEMGCPELLTDTIPVRVVAPPGGATTPRVDAAPVPKPRPGERVFSRLLPRVAAVYPNVLVTVYYRLSPRTGLFLDDARRPRCYFSARDWVSAGKFAPFEVGAVVNISPSRKSLTFEQTLNVEPADARGLLQYTLNSYLFVDKEVLIVRGELDNKGHGRVTCTTLYDDPMTMRANSNVTIRKD